MALEPRCTGPDACVLLLAHCPPAQRAPGGHTPGGSVSGPAHKEAALNSHCSDQGSPSDQAKTKTPTSLSSVLIKQRRHLERLA